MPKQIPAGLPASSAAYSQLVEAQGLVFVAGQVGQAPGIPGPVPGGIAAEARATFENVRRLLRSVGLDVADVIRCTVYLVDFDDFSAMNAVFREVFPDQPPARTTVGVTALDGDYRIEIEATATR